MAQLRTQSNSDASLVRTVAAFSMSETELALRDPECAGHGHDNNVDDSCDKGGDEDQQAPYFGAFFWFFWLLVYAPTICFVLLCSCMSLVGTVNAFFGFRHLLYSIFGNINFTKTREPPLSPCLRGTIWVGYVLNCGLLIWWLGCLLLAVVSLSLLNAIFIAPILVLTAGFVRRLFPSCWRGSHTTGKFLDDLGLSVEQSTDFTLRILMWSLFPTWDVRRNVLESRKERTDRNTAAAQNSSSRSVAISVWVLATILFVIIEIALPIYGFVTDLNYVLEVGSYYHGYEYMPTVNFRGSATASMKTIYNMAVISFAFATASYVYGFARLGYQIFYKRYRLGDVILADSMLSAIKNSLRVSDEINPGPVTRAVTFVRLFAGDLLQLVSVLFLSLGFVGLTPVSWEKVIGASVSVALILGPLLFRVVYSRVMRSMFARSCTFLLCLLLSSSPGVTIILLASTSQATTLSNCNPSMQYWFPDGTQILSQDIASCSSFQPPILDLTIPDLSSDVVSNAMAHDQSCVGDGANHRPAICSGFVLIDFLYLGQLSDLTIANNVNYYQNFYSPPPNLYFAVDDGKPLGLAILDFGHLLSVDNVVISNNSNLTFVYFGALRQLQSLTITANPQLEQVICSSPLYVQGSRTLLLDTMTQSRVDGGMLTIAC